MKPPRDVFAVFEDIAWIALACLAVIFAWGIFA
jgi:hypothetical protein